MTPKQKWVKVMRWDCGDSTHSHLTEKIAMACMIKQDHGRKYRQHMPSRNRKRIQAMQDVIIYDKPWSHAAKILEVSKVRASQIVRKLMLMSLRKPILNDSTIVPFNWHWPIQVEEARQFKNFWENRIKALYDYYKL